MNQKLQKGKNSFLLLSAMIISLQAQAAHYEFSQSGYVTELKVDGRHIQVFREGKISGSFDGADLYDEAGNDAKDGFIVGALDSLNEITNFSLKLSGNAYFNSFYSTESAYFDDYHITYDIKNNTLGLKFSWEGSYKPDFMAAKTGYTFFDYVGNSVLDVAGDKGSLGSGAIFVDGFDKEGNQVDVSRQFYLDSTSTEKMVVNIIPTPLPGALVFFVSGLAGLVMWRKAI